MRRLRTVIAAAAVAGLAVTPVLYAPPSSGDTDAPADGAGLRLDPHYEAGQRWTVAFEARWDATTATANGQAFPSDLVSGQRGSHGVWVLEADGGELQRALIQFDKCISYTGTRDQQNPPETAAAHSNEEFVYASEVSPITDETRVTLTRRGEGDKAIPADFQDTVGLAFAMDLLPSEPVEVGHRWKTKKVGAVFGATGSGEMTLKLARHLRGEDGRDKAVVAVEAGTFTQGVGQGGTLSIDYAGNLRVDLKDRLVDRVELKGTCTLEMTMGTMTSEQRGPWTYSLTAKLFEPKPPTEAQLRKYAAAADG